MSAVEWGKKCFFPKFAANFESIYGWFEVQCDFVCTFTKYEVVEDLPSNKICNVYVATITKAQFECVSCFCVANNASSAIPLDVIHKREKTKAESDTHMVKKLKRLGQLLNRYGCQHQYQQQ